MLSRHIRVDFTRVICPVPITTPQRISISTILIFTVTGGSNVILLIHIVEAMSINKPGTYRFGIIAEYFFKVSHVNVYQLFPLSGRIAGRKADISAPVPEIPATPLHAGIFNKRLGDLPP